MNIDRIHAMELEITSNCNAACPGCARTLNPDLLDVTSFSFNDLKRLLPDRRYIENKRFKFCGVLGDPAIHPEFIDMVEYLLENNCSRVNISTNGGVGNVDTWNRLGKLATFKERAVCVDFCIDGHEETNHIYRVNTKWNVIMRNIKAFVQNAKERTIDSSWTYIVFDHNEHELDTAIKEAKKFGLKFNKRTGMRNSYFDWIANIRKKKERKQVVITTTGKKEHKAKEQVYSLEKAIKENAVDENIIKSIKCKYVHEGEIFIGADLTMWPCCFLYDSKFKNAENINEKLSIYLGDWNNLKNKTIDEVLAHPYYESVLEDSWNPAHNLHMARCVKTCGYNQAYHNKKELVV
tara:strand:+ start:647 stop:1696 length:1050 start_codon:yes stop_codon:yes gene_type:complete